MEKPNPKSRKGLKSWSELPIDLLSSVFELLGFADFTRGRSVCSSWYSGVRQYVRKSQLPWLILLPENKNKKNNCFTLFNPDEKYKCYKTQELGLEFAKSVCLGVCKATYGSWLLMRDPWFNLYIVNIFTQERINLPSLESQLGTTKIERKLNNDFRISNDHTPNYKRQTKGFSIQSPVFWIDEKTKDYVVVWGLGKHCVVYSKKGDTSWNQIPDTSNCFDMVYIDHTLYFLSHFHSFKIFDFLGEIPQETFQCDVVEAKEYACPLHNSRGCSTTKLVVTVTRDVLVVESSYNKWLDTWSFCIHKVCSSDFLKFFEEVHSLGDEALLFDRGITVLANDTNGFKRNSIYLEGRHATVAEYKRTSTYLEGKHANTTIFIFNLEARNVERLHNFNCLSIPFSKAVWFLPSFMQT